MRTERERERERWYECFARFSTDERWRNSIAGRVVGPSRRILLRRNEGPRRNEWLVAWDYPGRETGVEKPGSVSLDSIVIRFSILFLGLLVSFSFIFHPTGNGGETAVPSRTFSDCSLVCRPVGCSQSLKIADPLARWTIRGRSRGIWAISIETIVVFNLKYYAALSVRLRKLGL